MVSLRKLVVLALLTHRWVAASPNPHGPAFDDHLFARARAEKRLVILNLEAVWCHWCHVMQNTTYRDSGVQKLIQSRYLMVSVDSDARPDIAHRYEDYGWPATIIYDSQGRELRKLSGYIKPDQFRNLLARLAKDPRPDLEPEEVVDTRKGGKFSAPLLREMEARHFEHYDYKLGGFGSYHKFLNWNSCEYALHRARQGDEKSQKMALQTLNAQLQLIDPVWGGVYQYSDSGVWDHPHFEKVMDHQSGNLRIYSLAYAQFNDPRYLQAAGAISRYLREFLSSPEGGSYTSQDADLVQGQHSAGYFALSDRERRQRGIPRIDKNCYARETGWACEAQALYSGVSGDAAALEAALQAGRWLVEKRLRPDGSYRHGDSENEGGQLYLADTLSAGRAFLALYGATADVRWLERAESACEAIQRNFRPPQQRAGWMTSTLSPSSRVLARPTWLRDENISAFRFANQLRYASAKPCAREVAAQALSYLAIPGVAREYNTGGVLLCEAESRSQPVSVTVVGAHQDSAARALFSAALGLPTGFRHVVWWDPSQPPPEGKIDYPPTPAPVVYFCPPGQCVQVRSAEELRTRWKRAKLP